MADSTSTRTGFRSSFTSAAGQTFDALDWGTLAGAFGSLQLPGLPSRLAWNTSQLYATGMLSIDTMPSADYSHNNVVDAADYILWRKGLGTKYIQGDYANWRAIRSILRHRSQH